NPDRPDAPAAPPPDLAGPGSPPGGRASFVDRFLDRLASWWPRLDGPFYVIFAGACVLHAALTFYGSLHRQTHGVWSAPLDDVFIHFDYARATAPGYPFQWSAGNGVFSRK